MQGGGWRWGREAGGGRRALRLTLSVSPRMWRPSGRSCLSWARLSLKTVAGLNTHFKKAMSQDRDCNKSG